MKGLLIHVCLLAMAIIAPPLSAAGIVLPDSMVTEDKVYEYTFSDTRLAEQIMAEMRRRGELPTYEMDMTEGDLYYNTGRFIMATRLYKNALTAKAVRKDPQKTMKLLHWLISCYDGLYDEEKKAEAVKLLLREREMQAKGDTINLYMSSTLKFCGMAYRRQGQYDKAASCFERLAVLRDSLRVREMRSSSQELSLIYDVKDKEAQIVRQRWVLAIAFCILLTVAVVGCVFAYSNHIIRKKNISLVAAVKEAVRYKEKQEKTNGSRLPGNIMSNADANPDELLFGQIEEKIIKQKFFIDNTFSRKTLMDEFNIPANKFAGLFRHFTGKTFSEYINNLRIEYVAELLLSGRYASVEDLLKECTFISSTTLYRLFTKKYGMTPQKFLRNARLC